MLSFNKVAGVGVFPWILVKFKNIYFVQNLRVTTFVLLKLTQFGFCIVCELRWFVQHIDFVAWFYLFLKTTLIWNLVFLNSDLSF